MSDSETLIASLERAIADLPECTDADGLLVRDNAGRVVAAFTTEAAPEGLISLVEDFAILAETWTNDLEELGQLQASDEGHQEETAAAERECEAEKRRADAAEVALQDAQAEIERLKKALAVARRERL